MKVRNLYIGKISQLKNAEIKYDYDYSYEDPELIALLAKRNLHAIKQPLRISIFYKSKNSKKMKDIIFGGKYPIRIPEYCDEEKYEGLQYISEYSSIATSFTEDKIPKRKLLKKYKGEAMAYNKEQFGGKNE